MMQNIIIQPSTKLLAVSKTKLQYIILDELRNCKLATNNMYICKLTEPMYATHVKPICETELLLSRTEIPDSCDTRVTWITNEIWHKLEKKNQWIYVLPKNCEITISCQGNNKMYDVKLFNLGMLELYPHCKAFTPSTTLIAENTFKSNYTAIIPHFNIIEDDCCTRNQVNFTESVIFRHIPIAKLNLDTLHVTSHKLNQISSTIDEMMRRKEVEQKFSFYSYIMYAIGFIIVIYILYKIVKYCTRKCKNRNQISHTHDDDSANSCTKIVNCLTLNVANRRMYRRNMTRATTLELSEREATRMSESEDEMVLGTDNPLPSRRSTSVIKDKI